MSLTDEQCRAMRTWADKSAIAEIDSLQAKVDALVNLARIEGQRAYCVETVVRENNTLFLITAPYFDLAQKSIEARTKCHGLGLEV